jgi:hypothetical protein
MGWLAVPDREYVDGIPFVLMRGRIEHAVGRLAYGLE